jgi:hypothetical protein
VWWGQAQLKEALHPSEYEGNGGRRENPVSDPVPRYGVFFLNRTGMSGDIPFPVRVVL